MKHREGRWRFTLWCALVTLVIGGSIALVVHRQDPGVLSETPQPRDKWHISRVEFRQSEAFPEVAIHVIGGTINDRINGITLSVKNVWQANVENGSGSAVPADWVHDLMLPVLGAPYSRTITLDHELIPGESKPIVLVLGSDAPPHFVSFIYDATLELETDNGSTLELSTLFTGESANKAVVWSTRGLTDEQYHRNVLVADSLKDLDRTRDEETEAFLIRFSEAGVSEYLELLDDPKVKNRLYAVDILRVLGHRAKDALESLRRVASKDPDYIVRQRARNAIMQVQTREPDEQALPIPDPIDLAMNMRAWQEYGRQVEFPDVQVPNSYENFGSVDWRLKGNGEFDRGDFDEAIESFSKALELALLTGDVENIWNSRFWRGRAYLSAEKNFEGAIQDFSFTIENPRFGDWIWPYRNRAIAFRQLQRYDKAIADLTHAISLGPYGGDYLTRALVFWDVGDLERAESDLRESARLNPGNSNAELNLAEFLIITNRADEVIGLSRKVDSHGPQEPFHATIAYFLDAVAHLISNQDTRELDEKLLIAVNDTAAASGDWSFELFERWLTTARLEEEKRRQIAKRLELLSSSGEPN